MAGGFEFGDDDASDTATAPIDVDAPADLEPPDDRRPSPSTPTASDASGPRTSDGDRAERDPDPELDALLYDGETAEASVPLDDGRLVRTSHRLLLYTPETDGRTLTVVQGPNVEDVSLSASGRGAYVSPALKSVLVGGVLLAAGSVVPVDGMAGAAPSSAGAGATGMGGTITLLGDVMGVIALLDDALRTLGALVLLGGVALLGLYLRSRKREVVVSVAGDEDLTLPAGGVTEADVARVAAGP
ncbi:hypothetical protein [Halorarum halobium]|uniref:hypothetical protein n=1 Tax=Halorarum halobium TaxID=3075121 RepID=UPI0028A8C05F|nr:hypothetical protein [Halobaculum sp. XH14]